MKQLQAVTSVGRQLAPIAQLASRSTYKDHMCSYASGRIFLWQHAECPVAFLPSGRVSSGERYRAKPESTSCAPVRF